MDQLSKDLALAASAAGGAAGQGGVQNQQEVWNKVLEDAKLARQNGVSIKDVLIDIRKAVEKLIPGGGNAPAAPGGPAPGRGGVAGGALGGILGSFLPGGTGLGIAAGALLRNR